MANWYVGSVEWSAVTAWAAATVYNVGDIRRQLAAPTVGNERVWRCTTAGTSGGSEPAWTLTKGSTTNDNTVVWTEITGQAIFNGDGGGTNWAAPHARLANALASGWAATTDTVYVANDHAETQTTALTVTPTGSQSAPSKIYCVSTAAVPPTSLATSGTLTSSAAAMNVCTSNNGFGNYFYGLQFIKSGSDSAQLVIGGGSFNAQALIFDNCIFNLSTTSSSSFINLNMPNAPSYNYNGCTFLFGNSSQYISLKKGFFSNCTFASSGTVPTTLFKCSNFSTFEYCVIRDSDLSAITGNIMDVGFTSTGILILENCKLGAGVSPLTSTAAGFGGMMLRMHNCDSTNTNYRFFTACNYAGTCQQETTIVRTGGASDGVTPISWKIVTTANVTKFLPWSSAWPLGEEIAVYNTTTGSGVTITVYLTTNASLDNSNCWIEIEYLGNSSFPIASLASTRAGLLASGVALTADASVWGGGALSNKYSISTSVTPQMKGPIKVRIFIGSASSTVYFDPKIGIS